MISGDPKLPQLTPEEAQDTHLTTGFYRRFQDRFYTLWRDLTRQLAQTGQETSGGTGQTSYTKGDTLYASDTNTLATLAGNTTTTKKFLAQTGNGSSSAAPTWASIIDTDLPTVPVSKGGTGQTTYTDGQLLIGNSSGNTLTKATLSQGTGISIVNGNGSITISATGAGGGGDVLGPGGGATDNAVARFDGATGQLIQNSVVVIDDSGNVSGGSWQGSVVSSTYGGTGINNGGRTLTISTNSGTLSFTNASKTLTIADTASVSGTNTGDQTITLQGDVTGSGTGTFTTTIAHGSVSNAKLANVATATFKGRTTAGAGAPEDLTATQATALLNTFTDANKGLAPASGGGTTNFLRADGTWTTPGGGGTVTSVSVTTANGVSGTVASSTTTPAITLSLGAITPTSVSTGALTATGNVGFDGGTFVFNESGADKDFRVEGDTDANLVFVDASTDRVGIGTNSPSYKLQVEGGAIGKGGALGHHVDAYSGATDYDKIAAAITAALTNTNGSNVVVFAAREYSLGNNTVAIDLQGRGIVIQGNMQHGASGKRTQIKVNGGYTGLHIYDSTNSVNSYFSVKDMMFTTDATSDNTTAVKIGSESYDWSTSGSGLAYSDVINVLTHQFRRGFVVTNCRHITFDNCTARRKDNLADCVGLTILGGAYGAGDLLLTKCDFDCYIGNANDNAVRIYAEGSGDIFGLNFDQCFFYHGGTYGSVFIKNGKLSVTGASGTGTTATLTFATQAGAPYKVGSTITVSGVTPSGYNGTYTVTACTTTSVSFASATTTAYTSGGTISARAAVEEIHFDHCQWDYGPETVSDSRGLDVLNENLNSEAFIGRIWVSGGWFYGWPIAMYMWATSGPIFNVSIDHCYVSSGQPIDFIGLLGVTISGNTFANATGAANALTSGLGRSGDTLTYTNHYMVEWQKFQLRNLGGGTAPGGLTLENWYFARDVNANDWKVASTYGGAAITLTSAGSNWGIDRYSDGMVMNLSDCKCFSIVGNSHVSTLTTGNITVGYLVKVDANCDNFTVHNNVGHANRGPVFDLSSTTNKSIRDNFTRWGRGNSTDGAGNGKNNAGIRHLNGISVGANTAYDIAGSRGSNLGGGFSGLVIIRDDSIGAASGTFDSGLASYVELSDHAGTFQFGGADPGASSNKIWVTESADGYGLRIYNRYGAAHVMHITIIATNDFAATDSA